MHMGTSEDVEEFKTWIRTLTDPNGVLTRSFRLFCFHLALNIDTGWWKHKEMHQWLFPGIIQCLSDINPAVWHLMKATINSAEVQHAANNAETGIGMGLVQSFIQYKSFLFCLYVAHYSIADTRHSIPGTRLRSKSCFRGGIDPYTYSRAHRLH